MDVGPRLHFQVYGDASAPALLFLHGFLGSSDDWRAVAESLASEYFCICPDLPGHGHSVGLGDAVHYTLDGCCNLLVNLMADCAAARYLTVGYSMGGRVSLCLARLNSKQIAGMILESASPGIQSEPEREARLVKDRDLAAVLRRDSFEAFISDWYAQALFKPLMQDPGRAAALLERRKRNVPGELALALENMTVARQPDLWPTLQSMGANMVAVAGELDQKYAVTAEAMARLSKSIEAVIVPGAGHNVHAEQPDAFIGAVKDFARRIYGAGA